jgi:citrate lyase subunit beta/citryl-CoA lyase
VISSRVNRSYLFAPGHNAKLLGRVFTVGADAVILDLEDAVAPAAKRAARGALIESELDPERSCRVNRRGRVRRPRRGRAHAAASIPKCESVTTWVAAGRWTAVGDRDRARGAGRRRSRVCRVSRT